jgi:hypothetical protein
VKKKSLVLRISPEFHAALQKWASDEFRSLNGQIEFLLNRALRDAGRLKKQPATPQDRGKKDSS